MGLLACAPVAARYLHFSAFCQPPISLELDPITGCCNSLMFQDELRNWLLPSLSVFSEIGEELTSTAPVYDNMLHSSLAG